MIFYNRSLTINKTKNLNATQDNTKYMDRKLSRIPKENYPYARDNIESLLKSEVNFRNEVKIFKFLNF